MTTIYPLSQLGWTAFFQQQLNLDEWTDATPARVMAQHRSRLELLCEQGPIDLPITAAMPPLTVGDWLLLNADHSYGRALERLSVFSRKAAGSKVSEQLIAANVDTVFITTALNRNFNLNRIERYLAPTREAGAEAVVVLTQADLCEHPDDFRQQVQALDPMLMVETVNALDASSTAVLQPWCRAGQTVALLGSSGVGKSTLINTLLGQHNQQTGAARGADDKGRHTTTGRSLWLIPDGGLLLDTPGMRELQLAGCESGIEETFADISELIRQCRYNDCQHGNEPGCAVQATIESAQLDERRFANYQKLMREQAHNSASLAERRAKERDFSRYCRSVMDQSKRHKQGR